MGVNGLGRDEEGGEMKIAQLEKLHLFHLLATFLAALHIS